MAFGKRSGTSSDTLPSPAPSAAPKPAAAPLPASAPPAAAAKPRAPEPAAAASSKLKTPEVKPEPVRKVNQHSDQYYATKTTIFNALIDTIDLSQLAQLDTESAREEIRDIVVEIISI